MTPQATTSEIFPSEIREEIIKEAKRLEESTLHSSKGHFNAASFWGTIHYFIGVPTTILAAIAAASAFSKFDENHVVGGVISIIVAVLSALATFLNPNDRQRSHFDAANKYDALNNRTRIFWTIVCRGNDSDQVLTNKIKGLSDEKTELNKKSRKIFWIAYKMAKRGIAAGEADYKVDKPKS